MSGNGGRKCSGVTVKAFGMVAMNPCGGTKGACRHVSTPMLKSAMKLRKCYEK